MNTNENKEKMPKPFEKFLWLFVSVIIAAIGSFLRTSDLDIPAWVRIICVVLLMASVVIAAHKVSIERNDAAKDKEKKLRYFLKTILYYIFILVAVVYIFISLWVSGILSI